MARKERGFFGKMIIFLLAVFAVIGLIAMALSILSPYIPPKRFVWAAYFGLAFWEIFAFNVVVFVLLLLMWSRKVWIAVLALAISIPGVKQSYSFGSKAESADSFRVMSYNVHYFSHLDSEVKRDEFVNQVINMVREQSPDVFCCQEFRQYLSGKSYQQCIMEFANGIGYPFFSYNQKNTPEGNVIFSKYPLSDAQMDFGKKGYGTITIVDAGERGLFYVANVHLVSYNITNNELRVLENPAEQPNLLDTLGMSVVRNLISGFRCRNEQMDVVLEELPQVDAPVIVCGDFNETPVSYVHRKMRKAGYTDSFLKVGRGIKPTYAGKLPLLRIDYCWVNDKVRPLHFTRIRRIASDHYPIIMDFAIQQ